MPNFPYMVTHDEKKQIENPVTSASDTERLEKVREILFGAIHRDIDEKMVRAGSLVAERVHDLEQEQRRRTQVLEAYLKKEAEALAGRSEQQRAESAEALRTLTREQHDVNARLERRIAELEKTNAEGLRQLRRELLEQAQSFLDELKELRKEMLFTATHEVARGEGARQEARGEERPPRH
jgi:hypothetical protein